MEITTIHYSQRVIMIDINNVTFQVPIWDFTKFLLPIR